MIETKPYGVEAETDSAARSSALHTLVEGPEKPNLGHIVIDLRNAIEEGTFEVETPTLNVDMSRFSTIELSKTTGPKVNGQIACQPGPPMMELSFSWYDAEGRELYSDLDSHARHDNVLALYGDMHVWNVFDPIDFDMEGMLAVDNDDVQYDCEARMGWRDFEVAGWS